MSSEILEFPEPGNTGKMPFLGTFPMGSQQFQTYK